MGALHVRLVRRDAHLAGEAEDRVVLRAEPRSPAVDGQPTGAGLGPDAAAHAIARFEHGDRLAGLRQAPGRGQSRIARADDADIDVETLGHAAP